MAEAASHPKLKEAFEKLTPGRQRGYLFNFSKPKLSKTRQEKIEQYIVDIVFASRFPKEYKLQKFDGLISYGGSPRASINLALASKAYAFIKRRGYVIPEDVRAICHDVLRHRIGLTYEAEAENMTTEEIITDLKEDSLSGLEKKFSLLKEAQPKWNAVPLKERIKILQRFSELLKENIETNAAILTSEGAMERREC